MRLPWPFRRYSPIIVGILYIVCMVLSIRFLKQWMGRRNPRFHTPPAARPRFHRLYVPDPEFEKLMSSRRARLEDTCGQLRADGRHKFSYNFEHLFVLEKYHLVYCPVFKAGTSAWFQRFIELAPEKVRRPSARKRVNPIVLARDTAPVMSRTHFINYLKQGYPDERRSFLIVRHPFERLVSAFRDKIERLHSETKRADYYYKKYGKEITSRFRKKAWAKFGRDMGSRDFTQVSEEQGLGAILPSNNEDFRRDPDLPIFWEFVQYVIESNVDKMDGHWRPIHSLCSICMVHYDAIVKLEDLDTEDKKLVQYLGLAKELGMSEDSTNNSNVRQPIDINANAPAAGSSETTRLYFNTLDDEDIEKLAKIYNLDFQLFGYTFEFKGKKYF